MKNVVMVRRTCRRCNERQRQKYRQLCLQCDAFIEFSDAFAKYLKAIGWNAVLVSSPRIQQPPGEHIANYEFVVRFTGMKLIEGQK